MEKTILDPYERIMKGGYYPPVAAATKQISDEVGQGPAKETIDGYRNIIDGGYNKPVVVAPQPVQAQPGETLVPVPQVADPAPAAPMAAEPVQPENVPFKQGTDVPDLNISPKRKIDYGHTSSGEEMSPEAAGIRQ